MDSIQTKKIRVYGIVQGVGFRPTVSRHAASAGVTGSVCNKGPYVEIHAQGTEEQIECFLDLLHRQPPKRAVMLKVDVKDLLEAPVYDSFDIIESARTKGEIFVSPDIAICEECKKELYTPGNPRYLHPFINCTCCGPRLTILESLPYDRVRTSMKKFPMCPRCEKEYHDPATRRYDAQPVCCNDCGPTLTLLGREERGLDALRSAREVIRRGGIVAVKGIGGFHLCCDASSPEAVANLRGRKTRPRKPFAVMMKDLDVVRRECELTPPQEEMITGHQKPIVLLPRRKEGIVCEGVAPGNPKLGVMLPYAPVQLLLFDMDDGEPFPDCLVMTSGNESGAPICRDDASALAELSELCDCILSNDRDIRIRSDDTVMDFYGGEPYMIRRSRGFAPLPVLVADEIQVHEPLKGQVLAIGGELKNAFCIGSDNMFYLSPYIGDLADIRTVDALEESIRTFEHLVEVIPTVAACDLHPKYNSVAVAERLGLPLIRVQHHYAHVLSCMAENNYLKPVIGVAFDGTGYGTDGTIWGGEIMQADVESFDRIVSIAPFVQAGGDRSAEEGWRNAVSMIAEAYPEEEALACIRELSLCGETEARIQRKMMLQRINAVTSTSAGRLFDAVSAVLGLVTSSLFEGEAATALQFKAEDYERTHRPEAELLDADLPLIRQGDKKAEQGEVAAAFVLPTDELFRYIVEERRRDLRQAETIELPAQKRRFLLDSAGRLAFLFHKKLAQMIAAGCEEVSRISGLRTVMLSGGVYQNLLLLQFSIRYLREAGFSVFKHTLVPPNDGGIALGQAVKAMAEIGKNRR